MTFPKHVFRSYDIRGLVEGEITPEFGYRIGRAFVSFLEKKRIDVTSGAIVVGRDMRPSGVAVEEELIRAINDAGVDAASIGLVSTPLFGFAAAHFPEHIAGIMVTASHNPAEYNGFKLCLGDGAPIGGSSGLMEIRDLAEGADWADTASSRGEIRTLDPKPAYFEKIWSRVNPEDIRPMHLVIDAGNGMADVTYPALLEQLPQVKVEFLYLEPDGTFPNHEANPLKTETLQDLRTRVKEVGADLGFALDGDADRIGVVDERGEVVEPSLVGALIGLAVLERHPGAHMLYDLRSSDVVREAWEAHGATTGQSMVGHANIKQQMREEDAVFASELSLHLYYRDVYFLESGELSLMYLLELMSSEGKTLSALCAPLRRFAHSGERNFEVADKAAAIARVREKYEHLAVEKTDIDGLWLRFDWGWFSVRASNTENVLRLNLETRDQPLTEAKVAELTEVIMSS